MDAEQKLVFPCGEMLAKPHEPLCEAVEVKARPLPLGGYLQPWLWQVLGEGGVLSQERGAWCVGMQLAGAHQGPPPSLLSLSTAPCVFWPLLLQLLK